MESAEFQAPDAAAWRVAFSSHSGPVHRFLRRRLGPDEADDLLQETFLRAMRLGTPSRIQNIRSYLFATAKHLALNALRRPRLVSADTDGAPTGLDDLAARDPGPHEHAAFNVLSGALGRALANMPPTYRRAFELAVLEGRSYEEVARATGTTLAQVKVHVFRARRRLVEALGTYR